MGDHQHHAFAAIGPEPLSTEAHDVASTGPDTEPARQCITGAGTIPQECDRPESGQKLVCFLQQDDRDRCDDAGTGILQDLPEQQNGPAMRHHGEHHHAEAVPDQVVSSARCWFGMGLASAQSPRESAGRRGLPPTCGCWRARADSATACSRAGNRPEASWFSSGRTRGFAKQQPGHHPGEEHQMAPVANRAVLTKEVVLAGLGNHRGIGLE